MSISSKIEWTDTTWNPITGCSPISSGCINCYAQRIAIQMQRNGIKAYKEGFEITEHEDRLDLPLQWKKPRKIFVNSMGDLFHEKVLFKNSITGFLDNVINVIEKASWHKFQILTKRPHYMCLYFRDHKIPPNLWLGITVENNEESCRIISLKESLETGNKFISFEPLLEEIKENNLNRLKNDIKWVIVGGESGNNARPIREEWILSIKTKCEIFNIPFFFKQWGGIKKIKGNCLLNNQEYKEFPKELML